MNTMRLAEMCAILKNDPATSHMKLRIQSDTADDDAFFDYYVVTEDNRDGQPVGVVAMTRWHMDETWQADWRDDNGTYRLESKFTSPQKAMRAALDAWNATRL